MPSGKYFCCCSFLTAASAEKLSFSCYAVRWRIFCCFLKGKSSKRDFPVYITMILNVRTAKEKKKKMRKTFRQAQWITSLDFCKAPVNMLFHRQLEKTDRTQWDLALQNQHLLFRKKFTVDAGTLRAPVKLFITADDYYKLYINGKFAGMGPAPGYHFHYFCNEIDVTGFCRKAKMSLLSIPTIRGLSTGCGSAGTTVTG